MNIPTKPNRPQLLTIGDSHGFIDRLRRFCGERGLSMTKFVRLSVVEAMERTLAREEYLRASESKGASEL